MPDNLKAYCGVPLLLLKALYGYTFSGKFLYKEQEEFLIDFGMRPSPMPAIWRMSIPGGGILLVLQYSDNFLISSTDAIFKNKFQKPFPTASRSNGSHMRIGSFRPVFDKTPMETFLWISIAMPSPLLGDIYQLPRPRLSSTDLRKFASPLPTNMVWTKTNSSKALSNVVSLETEY
jgi:hypothetical protein